MARRYSRFSGGRVLPVRKRRSARPEPSEKSARGSAASSRRMLFEQLEPRLLLSADLAPMAGVAVENTIPAFHLGSVDPLDAGVAPQSAEQDARSIVFIDAALADDAKLLSSLRSDAGENTGFVLLDADSDSLQQITDTLEGRSEIDSVHILSHGDTVVSKSLGAGTDYSLAVELDGSEATVFVNGIQVLTHTYNGAVTNGGFGLLTIDGASSFANVSVRSDDPEFQQASSAVSTGPTTTTEEIPSESSSFIATNLAFNGSAEEAEEEPDGVTTSTSQEEILDWIVESDSGVDEAGEETPGEWLVEVEEDLARGALNGYASTNVLRANSEQGAQGTAPRQAEYLREESERDDEQRGDDDQDEDLPWRFDL